MKADAIFTDLPGLGLLMRFADCVPILIHDPVQKVVGLVHAGWQGTVKQIARVAVEAMQERYQSKPADILAVIGPSICPQHYEVGVNVIEKVMEAFGDDSNSLLSKQNGKSNSDRMNFDLWKANNMLLEKAGLRNIEITGICTACHNEDWYSHRAERGMTGRFGVYIALPE